MARMPPYGGCLHSKPVNGSRQPALTWMAYGVPTCGSPAPSAPPLSNRIFSRGSQPSRSASARGTSRL
ncbi:hypothetical protein G6F45_014267 [Rhizopus arrhizus]|nr:hypothetical protein G6F45_014267 [Rhizopus arrhizus]